MLKRSKLLVAFLVVTVICASVGFAAVSDTLNADGNVAINSNAPELETEFDADVMFTNVAVSGTGVTTGVEAAIDSADDDQINITIPKTALVSQGKTVVITATVSNVSTVQAVALSASVDEGASINDGCVTVGVSVTDSQVAAEGTTTVVITVTLVEIPAEDISATDFSVQITADPVNA